MEEKRRIAFVLRAIQNQIKLIIRKSLPKCETGPKSQLQGGILGYLYHHREQPVYQRDLEKEFRISRATATNTLQVMEREGLIVRKAQDRDARLKRIQMTEEALRGHMRIEAHMEMMEKCITGGMTEEEVRQLSRLLGMVMKNLEGLAAKYDALPQENVPDFEEERQERQVVMVSDGGAEEAEELKEPEEPKESEESKEISGPEKTCTSRDGPG